MHNIYIYIIDDILYNVCNPTCFNESAWSSWSPEDDADSLKHVGLLTLYKISLTL